MNVLEEETEETALETCRHVTQHSVIRKLCGMFR